ncbi:hypothetical protein TRVL_04805 [Trypanosoma vivax]|uniref:WW domain-containing protein n=1 Tax=Trypanosoma vivax (strain Y486) TaxID=1055687 RepID=G0U3X7_TRYVY|nr:hypothetical protein TRVL_04805 [Trypanosoma vivax]CCC52137.1 conserved hypothetical protein [Trypanosoma vivax Y486]
MQHCTITCKATRSRNRLPHRMALQQTVGIKREVARDMILSETKHGVPAPNPLKDRMSHGRVKLECEPVPTLSKSEKQDATHGSPWQQKQLQAQDQEAMSEEALYEALCHIDGELLPPGWEKMMYHNTVVYLDHVSREAHKSPPWKVWMKRSSKTNEQS